MVGVVGSSPIAPTKQNPLCWAVWKGSPKGGPFFVVCDLQNPSSHVKTPTSSDFPTPPVAPPEQTRNKSFHRISRYDFLPGGLTHGEASTGQHLEDLTKAELMSRARTQQIAGRSTMRKAQLIEALRNA